MKKHVLYLKFILEKRQIFSYLFIYECGEGETKVGGWQGFSENVFHRGQPSMGACQNLA